MSTNEPSPREPADEWWATHPAHPCAAVFPLLTGEPFVEFVNDIKLHGLREPIALYTPLDDTTAYVLDGRNRANALLHLGRDPDEHTIDIPPTVDPASYVISRNLRRRHLTKEEQARLIVQAVEAAHRNDRATMARSFSPEPGKKGGSTKNPVLEASVSEAEKHDISKRTVQRAFTTIRQSRTAPPSPPTPPPQASPAIPLPPSIVLEREQIQARRKAATAARKTLAESDPVLAAVEMEVGTFAFRKEWPQLRKALRLLAGVTAADDLAYVERVVGAMQTLTDEDNEQRVSWTKCRAALTRLAAYKSGEQLLKDAGASALLDR